VRVRHERADHVDAGGAVLRRTKDVDVWWTFAGTRANRSLEAALGAIGIDARSDSESVTCAPVTVDQVRELATGLVDGSAALTIDQAALDGLKFSAA
jgi:ATP-dependent helicase Lhr and Lhr-like helicase